MQQLLDMVFYYTFINLFPRRVVTSAAGTKTGDENYDGQ